MCELSAFPTGAGPGEWPGEGGGVAFGEAVGDARGTGGDAGGEVRRILIGGVPRLLLPPGLDADDGMFMLFGVDGLQAVEAAPVQKPAQRSTILCQPSRPSRQKNPGCRCRDDQMGS